MKLREKLALTVFVASTELHGFLWAKLDDAPASPHYGLMRFGFSASVIVCFAMAWILRPFLTGRYAN